MPNLLNHIPLNVRTKDIISIDTYVTKRRALQKLAMCVFLFFRLYVII